MGEMSFAVSFVFAGVKLFRVVDVELMSFCAFFILLRYLISFTCFIVIHVCLFARFWTVANVGDCCWFVVPGGGWSSGWRRVAEGAWYSSCTDGAVVSISAA